MIIILKGNSKQDYYPFDLQYWGYHAIEIENQKKNILSVIIHNKIILFSKANLEMGN